MHFPTRAPERTRSQPRGRSSCSPVGDMHGSDSRPQLPRAQLMRQRTEPGFKQKSLSEYELNPQKALKTAQRKDLWIQE